MCGFTGFCDFGRRLNSDHLNAATNVLAHRGPDSGGTAFFDNSTANVGLGHRRLSIIDVSNNGNQPMYSDDKTVVTVFNGEIYNFKEVRQELETLGHSFISNSDTEVLIKAYQQYGIEAALKFNGMFAFAIYDIKKQIVFLLRDRAGVKPLYYFNANGCILFASELKSIYQYPLFEKSINHQAVSLFFKYGYIRAPHTIFKNTYKVQAGYYIKIDLNSKFVTKLKYYDVVEYYNKPKLKISEEDAVSELEKLFISAFQYRMISDVPVGVFLSGGYDSALVAGVLQSNNTQKIKTFTIGFEEKKFNEAPYAKRISEHLNTDHHEYYCTTTEAQDILPTLADIYDEPFGDKSAIPTTLVSIFARKHVTVSLSADGGDEIFAGYNRYPYLYKINRVIANTPNLVLDAAKMITNSALKFFPSSKVKPKLVSILEVLKDPSRENLADVFYQYFNKSELEKLLKNPQTKIGLFDDITRVNSENDFINTCLALDYSSYMADNILVKVDRATMSVGLEGREPLLDSRIIELASQLPSEFKYNRGDKKYILKKIAYKYVPKDLLERPKSGFSFPMEAWLQGDLKHYVYQYINVEQLTKVGFIDVNNALRIRDEFLSGKSSRGSQIWLLLTFMMWWNRWMP